MQSERLLKRQLEETQSRLDRLTEQVERNSRILARSQARELELLQAEDLYALLQTMLSGLKRGYGLEAVTVVLCDPDHDVRHLLLAGARARPGLRGLMFVDSLAGLIPQYAALRQPWLGRYSTTEHQRLFAGLSGIASVALIPLRKKRRLFGSINFASRDEKRFSADQATDFFAHLGAIASFALENAVNRERLRRSGFTDVLTGWFNRRYLQVRIREELARARRGRSPLSCLMLDIDHFKRVNDEHGHAAGDEVLRELAHRIESQIRATDVAARHGGEEFIILLPDTPAEAGKLLAERIRRATESSPFEVGETGLLVTVSIGVATSRPGRDDSDLRTAGDALIAHADAALYRAKADGRNQVAVNAEA